MVKEQDPSAKSNEAVSGPPHSLIQYPETQGVVPLAEAYDLPGTEIVWEENPFTRSDEQNSQTERKALIGTANGGLYYLRGGSLYDISSAASTGKIQEIRWTSRTPMPDITIGEPTPFSPESNIDQVLVRAGEVTASDPRSASYLDQAAQEDVNPFDQYDAVLEAQRAGQAMSRAKRQSNVDLTGLAVKDDGDEQSYKYTYRFRDRRVNDISSGRIEDPEDLKDPEDILHGATNKALGSKEAEEEYPVNRRTSRHGVLISPPIHLPKNEKDEFVEDDYVPRPEVLMKESVKTRAERIVSATRKATQKIRSGK